MALLITGTNAAFPVINAYLVVVGLEMSRHMSPTAPQEETMTNYRAKVHIYASQAQRMQKFGSTPLVYDYPFEHCNDCDAVIEAYEHIKSHGLPGWDIDTYVDAP